MHSRPDYAVRDMIPIVTAGTSDFSFNLNEQYRIKKGARVRVLAL